MTYPILRFFKYEHLPPHLAAVSRPFSELAHKMAADLPPGAEVSAGLRKLLEAKDCAVRAAVSKPAKKLTINGRTFYERASTLSYTQILALVGKPVGSCVTWVKGPAGAERGTLSPGSSVPLKEGQIFNVQHTTNA